MNVVQTTFRRTGILAAAVGLLSASLLPTLGASTAYAAPSGGQVLNRSITLSSSEANASGVTYKVQFNVASAYAGDTFKGMIVEFCNATGGSPIVTDSNCAAPDAPFSTAAVDIVEGTGLTNGEWTASPIESNQTVQLTNAIGETLLADAIVSFELTGIVNPGNVGTFYARVITYNSVTGDIEEANYEPGTEGSTNAIDYGGFALSTADSLTVTAKVQESLLFCLWTNAAGTNCADVNATGTDVVLGDTNGVLSNYETPYTSASTGTSPTLGIASNAQGGVTVRIKGGNLCRTTVNCTDGDDGNIIEPITTSGTMLSVADSTSSAVEQFGLRVSALDGTTATAPFNGAASNHGFDTNSTNGTLSPYGATLVSTSGPTDEVNPELEFMAKAATTTEAGIYTTSINLIATGLY